MKTFYAENLAGWHDWLIRNSFTESEVWLVFYKKESGKPCIKYEESVEEALCFGWVDSLIKNIDAESHARKFTPRKPGSNWSELNIMRAEKMIAAGRMNEAGMVHFKRSAEKKVPSGENRKAMAEEFRKALLPLLTPEVRVLYEKLPPSHQRQYAGWVMTAAKNETRQKRIDELSVTLLKGESLGLK